MKTLLAIVSILFYSSVFSASAPHYVGELYGGGVIIWVDCSPMAEHGLIAALTDQSAATGDTWEDASTKCAAYSAGGFHNWHLPTREELFLLCCRASHVPGGFLKGLKETNDSNDKTNYYWSSTPESATHAYKFFMWNAVHSGGTTNSSLHSVHHSARAVRAF